MTGDQLEKFALFHLESQRQNIIAIRSWIFQLIIMSGGIIGFTLPIFGANTLVRNGRLLLIGLFLLWVLIVLGFWYLRDVLSRENNKLTEQTEELKTNHSIKSEAKSDAKSYILDVLYGIFIIATLLIILSMIHF